jgi:Reverse transcriptase (RNA-dependent DNA polymerase)
MPPKHLIGFNTANFSGFLASVNYLSLLLEYQLIYMYMRNFLRVGWCGVYFSIIFFATNGVNQGGVLSPVLFCVYIDGMLPALSKTGVGCYIGNVFVGALTYADDIVLIAPSACAMRKLLNICDCQANEYHIMFNAEKSKCLAFLLKNRR